jgi:hypothetical protein
VNSDFDPVRFGRLESKVDNMESEMRQTSADVRQLLNLASQAQGARWLFGGAVGIFGAFAAWIISHLPVIFGKVP